MDCPGVSGLSVFSGSVPRILTSLGDLPIYSDHEESPCLPEQMHDDPWTWNKDQENPDTIVSGNRVLFHPKYAFGTTGVKGRKRLTAECTAYWEIRPCEQLFGTSIMFGIGTANAVTRLPQCFSDLLGGDSESYGLSHFAIAQHDGLAVRIGEALPTHNCSVGILFDGPNRRLSFFINGRYLATPFTELDTTKVWYPMVTSTAQQSQFVVERQLCLYTVARLSDLLITKVNECLDNESPFDLPLPYPLKMKILTERSWRKRYPPQAFPRGIVIPDSCLNIVKEMYRRMK